MALQSLVQFSGSIHLKHLFSPCFTETQVVGEINCSSQTVKRRIPYKLTYRKAEQKQFEIEAKNLEVQGYEDAMAKVTANFEGLKLEFGRGKPQYQIRALGQIQNQGKMLRLQAQWEEVTTTTKLKLM